MEVERHFKLPLSYYINFGLIVLAITFGLFICKFRKQIKFCWSAKYWVNRNAFVTKPEDEEMFHTVRSGPHTTEVDVSSTSHETSVASTWSQKMQNQNQLELNCKQ